MTWGVCSGHEHVADVHLHAAVHASCSPRIPASLQLALQACSGTPGRPPASSFNSVIRAQASPAEQASRVRGTGKDWQQRVIKVE